MHLIILSRGRYQKPTKTYEYMPLELRRMTTLVCPQGQGAMYRQTHPDLLEVLERPLEVTNVGLCREFIGHTFRGKDILVMDDDLRFRTYHSRGREGTQQFQLDRDDWLHMISEIRELFGRGFLHVGFKSGNTPPAKGKYNYCARICQAVAYSADFDPDSVEWYMPETPFAQDFYVNLQLLTRGDPNAILNEYTTTEVLPSGAAGGCTDAGRDFEKLNETHRALHNAFPEFVKLKSKTTTIGPWAGKEKLSFNIQWKKAYLSSGKELPQ